MAESIGNSGFQSFQMGSTQSPFCAINGAYDALVLLTKIDNATATAKDKFTVTFNKAVNTTTDKLTVKKSNVAVNLDGVTFAADGMSAIIDCTSNFVKGDYVITLTAANNTSSKTVSTVAEKVSSIVVTTKTAPLNNASITIATPTSKTYDPNCSVFANYQVLNQYGEKMANQTINWSASTGGNVGDTLATATADGALVIGNYSTTAVFVPGSTLYLTGVNAATGTVVNASVTVGLEAKADTTVFKGIYDTTTNKLIDTLPAGFGANRYVLLYQVADQYGNIIPSDNVDPTQLTMISTNPIFIVAPSTTSGTGTTPIGDVTYENVKIVPGAYSDKGGTTTIQSISNLTGKSVSYDISSDAKAAVKTFTMSAPTVVIAEGEQVEIPFTAVDQFGTAVVKYSDLNGKVTFSGSLALASRPDGTAKLLYTAPSTGATADVDLPVYLTSVVTDGGSFSSLMVNVKETAVPTTVAGVDPEIKTTIAQGASVNIYPQDLIIQDQYGRTLTDAKVNAWIDDSATGVYNALVLDSSYKATGDVSPFTVKVDNSGSDAAQKVVLSTSNYFTVAGKTDANLDPTEKLVFSLSTTQTPAPITASSKSIIFSLANQSQYASYEVADLGTMFNNTVGGSPTTPAGYNITVLAYGVKADGTKVLLPSDQISTTLDATTTTADKIVTDNFATISVNGAGYAASAFQNTDGTAKTISATATVLIKDGTTGTAAAVITKPLVITNATPVVTTVAVDPDVVTDGAAFVELDNGAFGASGLTPAIKATTIKDQYGVTIANGSLVDPDPSITISALTKVDGSNFVVTNNATTAPTVAGSLAGDKFTATFTYAGGKTVVVKFTTSNITLDSQAAPTGLGSTAPTTVANNDGTITNATTAMEYKLHSASTYTPVTAATITGLAAGAYDVRYAAKTGYNASPDAAVTVGPYVPADIANLTIAVSTAGVISGDTATNAGTLKYVVVNATKATEIALWNVDTTEAQANLDLGTTLTTKPTLSSTDNSKYLVVVEIKSGKVVSAGQVQILGVL